MNLQASTLKAPMLRLLLALILALCSEILLWIDPANRTIIGAGVLLAGYWALAGLLIDWLTRYRVQSFFGLLATAGLYGMLNGLLLNPQMALIDVPRTLLTRVMGAHTLMGLLALSIFIALQLGLRGRARRALLLIAAAGLGIGWGGWARWSGAGIDVSTYNAAPPFGLTPILWGAFACLLIGLIWIAKRRATGSETAAPPTPAALIDTTAIYKLSPLGYFLAIALLTLNGVLHLNDGTLDSLSLSIIGALIVFTWSILWYQTRKKGTSIMEQIDAGREPLLYWLAVALLLLIGGAIGYQLARLPETGDPVAWFGAIFTAFGLVWLPAVTLVVGSRAIARQARALKL
ncbi:MAG: hypothetical protein U0670_07035 [Anaerolineae bacterium]